MNIIDYVNYKPKKWHNSIETTDIANIIDIFAINLFEYNPPEGLDKFQVENALHSGIAALYKCNVQSSVNYNKWCCTPAYPATVIDNNKNASKITTKGTDYALELDVDKDCILLYNNSNKTSDTIIEKYSNLINEIDKTILSVVKWSRLIPIPKVRNSNDIAKYKTVMENVLNGELVNVISDNSYLLKQDSSSSVNDDLLTLTEPTASEKLHFLSEFREEVIKRLATLYGIPFNTTAKSAQALNAELHGMDIFSMFLLYDRYYARKESFERAKNFTGHDWNFDFSQIMQHQINDIMNHGNNYEVMSDETDNEIQVDSSPT